MNWKKESIQRLNDFEARKLALANIEEDRKACELRAHSIRAARTDGEPVKEGGNKREDALINNIVKRDELALNLEIAEREVAVTEAALRTLAQEEYRILYLFYINRPRGHVELLSEELCVERTRVYELKDLALRKFTLACYGVVEI